MSKNNLDIQTFQIYQDDESQIPTVETPTPKKKFGISALKKRAKIKDAVDNPVEDDGPRHIDVDGSGVAPKVENSSKGEVIKGLAIGFGALILFIAYDFLSK